MDRIRWINHAGFELQTEGVRIVCDPWLTGLAFQNSWSLLAETRYCPEDFEGVDYIWFSHEHPDHFSPADIRNIPPAVRAKITVLFQKTDDRRVVSFCIGQGFKSVRELTSWERIDLGPSVYFTLCAVGDDSLCVIETPEHTYLNVNDCVAADHDGLHQGIRAKLGKSPDVLLTQFSFANWAGNPGDRSMMRAQALQKLQDVRRQVEIYRPKTLIPFASYVWFCRAENFHLNGGSNKVGEIFALMTPLVACVVLYPDDVYEVGKPHDSARALARYAEDEAGIVRPIDISDRIYSAEELDGLSNQHQATIRSKNRLWSLMPLQLLGWIRPVAIYLTDINRSLQYSMFFGICWLHGQPREGADIEFTSEAFAQMLRYGSGYDTLYISGRFVERRAGAHLDLSKNFVVSRRNERGQYFPGVFFDLDRVRARIGIRPRAT